MTSPASPAAVAQRLYTHNTTADYGEPALVNPGQEPGQPTPEQPALDELGLPTKGTVELMQALAELDEAREKYELAEQMYDGEAGDLAVSDAVNKMLRKSNINDVEDLCYARVPVDTIASKLLVRAITVAPSEELDPATGQPLDPDSDLTAELAQDVLDEIRRLSQMDIEEPELILRASKYGEAYLEVWPVGMAVEPGQALDPDSVGPPDEESQATVAGLPESVALYVSSPVNVRAFYDLEQPLRLTHVLKSWDWIDPEELEQIEDNQEPKPRRRATLFYPDRIERWITKHDGNPGNREDWIPYLETLVDPVTGEEYEPEWPAPYPPMVDRIPFFHFRNARPYGCPEHRPAYGAQRLINKLVASQGVSIDFQVFPQRYMLLDPKADHAMMNLLDPDNPEDEDDDPEGDGSSQFRSDPAAVWKVYAQTIGQLDPADPQAFLTPLDRYIKAISELCGIPLDRFTGYTTPPSGEALKVGNEVLYEKARDRRKRYGGTLADAYEFALHLMGHDVEVDVKWEPLGPAVSAEDWNIVTTKVNAGVPTKVALVEAGYPEDEVESWLNDQSGSDLTRKVALLGQLGTAVQALAAGVGAGVVSKIQAATVIARVLEQISEDLPELAVPEVIDQPPAPPVAGGPGTMPPPPPPGEEGAAEGAAPAAGPMPPPLPTTAAPIAVL